jgi:nucleoside-diphosphate-sugar epimerase
MHGPVVILGLGFTTQRLARRLRIRGVAVYAAVRRPERFGEFESMGVRLCRLSAEDIPAKAILVHSIPPLAEPDNSGIHALITGILPRRILYISSTGVYGSQTEVNATTPASPNDEQECARLAEEEWIADSAFSGRSSLILRSAAIYGPGRGVHVRLREGKLPRGNGGVVSRIHVDDLASILEAGIESGLEGAWPVADELPAASEEVVVWCAERLGIAMPAGLPRRFPVTGRRVDGRKIRELLGVALKYPSYETGIAASLREETD